MLLYAANGLGVGAALTIGDARTAAQFEVTVVSFLSDAKTPLYTRREGILGSTIFLLDPHFGGDGLVIVIRHRDPDETWTIRQPSSWRPNWRGRQGLAVDGPTVRRRTAHGLESEWRER
jgi:hypothetical protein